SSTRSSQPSMRTAMRTLRTKGEDGDERRIIMAIAAPPAPAGRSRPHATLEVASAGYDEIDRLRAFALLVGLDIETDALTLIEVFQAGLLHRRDMHEYVAAAVVRLDETVAALAIEELHHTLLRHLETPTPQLAAGPTLGGAAWTFREGIGPCRPP